MSRVTELISFVKRDLNQYNMRDLNTAQILFALNKGQETITKLEDLLEADQSITIVTNTAAYAVGYQSGNTLLPIVKRIISIQWPTTWTYPIQWKTKQQFAELITSEPSLNYPLYVTYRNNKLEFWGIPTAALNGSVLKLHNYLKKQTVDMSDSVEPEILSDYDNALRIFAVYYLLPIDHEQKDNMYQRFMDEKDLHAGISNEKHSYPRSLNCTW